MNENTKAYFRAHRTAPVFYFTTDGQAFFNQADADAVAAVLEKRKAGAGVVKKVTRDEYDAVLAGISEPIDEGVAEDAPVKPKKRNAAGRLTGGDGDE